MIKNKHQLKINEDVIKNPDQIHPATLTELSDENGPTIWVLMIPTTTANMNDFIQKRITENELVERAQPGQIYTCVYLCSATTLPEYRGKGITKKLCVEAIVSISQQYPIKTLYVWPFTKEGNGLAESVAKACRLELFNVE